MLQTRNTVQLDVGGSEMTDEIEDLTEEVENLKIDEPKFEKWSELSPKLKLECMNSLDFKTRWNLRSTSKTEKSIADSRKFKIDKVYIDCDRLLLEITQNGVIFKKKWENADKSAFIALSEYILHHGILETLIIHNFNSKIASNFSGQYYVKNLEFDSFEREHINLWLKKMNGNLKSVKFDRMVGIYDLIFNPKIIKINSLTLFESHSKAAERIAEFWIENDAEVGRKFQIMEPEKDSLKQFADCFEERVLCISYNSVRITTDNPEKHILLEVDISESDNLQKNLRITVVAFNSFEEWIEEEEVEKPEDLIIAPYQFEKWNKLPDDMKLECIKWINIDTRMNLRRTSKTEKALVDLKKFKIDEVLVQVSMHIGFEQDGDWIYKSFPTEEDLAKYSEFLLKHATIELLGIGIDGEKQAADLFQKGDCQYSVKNLKFHFFEERDEENIGFLLDRMKLETLEIEHHSYSPSHLDYLFAFPNLSDISFIKIGAIEFIGTVDKLAQVWIEKDAKIGNKFQIFVMKPGSFEGFSQNFKDRLVLKSDQSVRIRTDNPSKHILLQVGHSTVGELNGTEEFLQMTVIPAGLKEYDTSEKWFSEWEKDYQDYIHYSDPEFDFDE